MKEISLPNVVEVLRRHESELQQIFKDSRIPPKIRRQVKDQAARSREMATSVKNYHERSSGVVRATNPNF